MGLEPPTVSDLKLLFAERGIRPNRLRGQNFLIDASQMRFVVEAAELEPRDVVLEPGPGTGGLTGLTAERAGAVVAVELDSGLYEIASERLAGLANVRVVHSDIMGDADRVAEPARRAVAEAMRTLPDARLKVVANLPYAISTAFIVAALMDEPAPADMVVTVQREVAERLCAAPGTDAYGYLSVVVQALAKTKTLRRLSPGCFWPQPEIDSAVVRVTPSAELRRAAGDLGKLLRVASGIFQFRRKQIAGALKLAGLADREDAERALHGLGIEPSARGEDLAVETFVALAKKLGD